MSARVRCHWARPWASAGRNSASRRRNAKDVRQPGQSWDGTVPEVARIAVLRMANGQLAWWFGGEKPDTRLTFRWGDIKGSRVLRGISEKRKVQWHFGISSQYHGGLLSAIFACAHASCFLKTERRHCRENVRTGCGNRSPRDGAMLVGGTCSSPFCFGCQMGSP